MRADVAAIVKHVLVDESLATGLTQTVLVEEQVSQTVVDEGAVPELHALWLVCLASADDGGSCIRHLAKIALLVGLRAVRVILKVLKRGDHKKAFRLEAADLACHPIHIAGGCSWICLGGMREGPAFRIAADERDPVGTPIDQ